MSYRNSASIGIGGDGRAGPVANENTPKLRTFDSRGNRRDEIEVSSATTSDGRAPPGLHFGVPRSELWIPAWGQCVIQLVLIGRHETRSLRAWFAARIEGPQFWVIFVATRPRAAIAADPHACRIPIAHVSPRRPVRRQRLLQRAGPAVEQVDVLEWRDLVEHLMSGGLSSLFVFPAAQTVSGSGRHRKARDFSHTVHGRTCSAIQRLVLRPKFCRDVDCPASSRGMTRIGQTGG